MKYIVELEKGVWLAPWEGDPGRTLVEASAERFVTLRSAKRRLGMARKYHPFKNARIGEVGV